MPKRRLILACCTAAAIAVTTTLLLWPHEPSYHGHSLSYWVRVLGGGGNAQTDQGSETLDATAALRSAGSNAVPYLVKWLPDETGPINRAIANFLCTFNTSLYPRYGDPYRTAGAKEGLLILGPEAKRAIPDLTRLMNDPSRRGDAQKAAEILPHLGPDALPSLAATLTNQYPVPIRYIVISGIAVMGTNARPVVPQLVQLLKDKDTRCASAAAVVLGRLRLEPDLVMPSLTNCLQAPRVWLRLAATEALLNFTNPPEAAQTTLQAMLSDSNPSVRIEATNVLRRTSISWPSPR